MLSSASFAARLSHLVATVHPPDRAPYSYREIEAGIRDRGGPAITSTYINQLANGKRENPSINAVEALAGFFGVPVEYFFDAEVVERINSQLSDLVSWRDTEARKTVERIMSLRPRDRRAVDNLIASLTEYENQPRKARERRKPPTERES